MSTRSSPIVTYSTTEVIVFAYRTSFVDAIGNTPFYFVHGRDPRLPTDVLAGTSCVLDIDAQHYGLFSPKRPMQLLKLIKSQAIVMANAITITAITWFTLPTEALSFFILPLGSPVFLPSSLTTMNVLSEFDANSPTCFTRYSFPDRSTY